MTLQSSKGSPMTYAQVRLTDPDGFQSYGWTDSLGQVAGLVPSNKNLLLEVLAYPCNEAIYSKNIGSFDQNSDLGVITINNSQSISSIRGKLLNCSNTPVTDGYAIIYCNDIVTYAAVNSEGNFTTDIVFCPGTIVSCKILPIDNKAKQQGSLTDINLTAPQTDVGNISACGTSSDQYINYTLDGIDHSLTSTTTDSLFGSTQLVQASPPNYTSIYGVHNPDYIFIGYLHNNLTGTVPMLGLALSPFDSSTNLTQPFNITISNYAQNVGDFYEGHFSGQFTHYSTGAVLHNINCSFRVRRRN